MLIGDLYIAYRKALIANCTVVLNRDRMWFEPRFLGLCFNNVWSGILLFTPIHVCCLVLQELLIREFSFHQLNANLLWPGTFAFAEWLVQHRSSIEGQRCIELGRYIYQLFTCSLLVSENSVLYSFLLGNLYMIPSIGWILIRLDCMSVCCAGLC